MLTIRPARFTDAQVLAPLMRAEDTAEVQASGGFTPLEALLIAMRSSQCCYAAEFHGELGAVWGVVPCDDAAVVWLLTGRAVQKHPKSFAKASRLMVAGLLEHYPVLTNWIDARYTAAIRWARWLGAEVLEPQPFGAAGLPFCRFYLRRPPHV